MEMYFETMFKNADRENSIGRTFTTSDIGEAFVICMGKLEIEESLGGECDGRVSAAGSIYAHVHLRQCPICITVLFVYVIADKQQWY